MTNSFAYITLIIIIQLEIELVDIKKIDKIGLSVLLPNL